MLFLEPWFGGSHARFVEFLTELLRADGTVVGVETMSARHWKWRMRGSAVEFAGRPAVRRDHDLIVATSYVALAELVGLAPELASARKLLVFHENQFSYPDDPERGPDPRDLHFAVTQLVSAACADRVVFNSATNRAQFLAGARAWLRKMPDARPAGWIESIEAKSEVLAVPIGDGPGGGSVVARRESGAPPLVLWNHRWEHDKAPEELFAALELAWSRGARFRLAVCGARARTSPAAFASAEPVWRERAEVWGPLERDAYEDLLSRADVVVSTARQEFLGLSVLEAVRAGAWPLVPDRVVYPELWPDAVRYRGIEDLADRLVTLCANPPERGRLRLWTEPFTETALAPAWRALIERTLAMRTVAGGTDSVARGPAASQAGSEPE